MLRTTCFQLFHAEVQFWPGHGDEDQDSHLKGFGSFGFVLILETIYMPVCMCMYIGHTRVCIHIPYIIDVSIIKTYTFFERAEYMDKYTKPAVKNRVVDM